MGSSVLDRASRSGRLVGDGPASSGASSPAIGRLKVCKSGQSVLFTPQDGSGNDLPVASVLSPDDVQVVAMAGVAASTSLRFRLGDDVTGPIALAPAPPMVSFGWVATLPQAGKYDLGMSWGYYGPPPNGSACTRAVYKIYDGGSLIGTVALDQSRYPDESIDLAVPDVGVFKKLGSFTFATTAMEVRLCGEAGSGTLLAGTLRLTSSGSTGPSGATDATGQSSIGYVDPSPNRANGSNGVVEGRSGVRTYGEWTLTFFHNNVGGWHGIWYAAPGGIADTAYPSLVDVQAAFAALPSIPAGSVRVAAISAQAFSISFVGDLSGRAQPTLAASDPAFKVIHDGSSSSSVGGQFPSLSINGVAHPVRAASFAVGQPTVVYHLIQDPPAVQYLRFGEGLFRAGGFFNMAYGVGFGGQVGLPTGAGPKGNWRFQGLPSSTYEVAITWPAGDPAGDLMDCLIQDGMGKTLASVTGVDQSLAPADFREGGVGWKSLGRVTLPHASNALTVVAVGRGADNRHLLLDTVRLARVVAGQGVAIHPGDSVRFGAPAGFVSTAAGPLPAVADLVVEPADATRLPAPTGRRSMKLGMNVDPPNYFGTDSLYGNLAIQALTPIGLAQSPQGNPTRLAFDVHAGRGGATTPLSQGPSDCDGRGRGVPSHGPGTWVLEWSSSPASECRLVPNATSTTIVEDTSRRVTGATSRRYYDVRDAFSNSPGVALGFYGTQQNADSTYACDVTNVAVYPPDVDPTARPKWRQTFLDKLRGLQCLRFMDLFGTNNMNLAKFEHFPDPANFPLAYSGRAIRVPIESIGPPTPDLFAENVAGTVIRVKTRVPHGLTTGFMVRLRTSDGSSIGRVLGNVVDPRTNATTAVARDPLDPTDSFGGQIRQNLCHVVDATTLQIGINVYSGPLSRMTNTLTPANGYIYADIAPGAMIAPADAADLCAQLGLEPWVNVPWLADDDCVTRLAQAFVARTPAGTRVHVEYGNEGWNYGFTAFFYCVWKNNLDGNPGIAYVPSYATRMGQVHAIFRKVWRDAGRDESEVRRVCGSHLNNPGATTAMIAQAAIDRGISFDEVAPATYYSNAPLAGPGDDLLTAEQLLDVMAANVPLSEIPGLLAEHRRVLADALARNPGQTWLADVDLVLYEGGPDTMVTSTMTANMNSRSHAVHRHPGFAEIALAHLDVLEAAGVKLFNIFTMYGTRDLYQWGVYEASHMQPGTGDPAQDRANVDDFEDLGSIKSSTAAALRKWAALRAPEGPAAPAIARNGIARAYGRPAY